MYIRKSTLLRHTVLTALLALLSMPAQATLPIQTFTTSTGVKGLFIEAPGLPMVDIRLVFHAGGARDGEQAGLSRLTNRLLDDGAGKWSADELAERFDNVGAQFGRGALRDMAWVSLRSLTDPELLNPAVETVRTLLAEPHFDKQSLARERNQMLTALQAQQQSPGQLASKAYYETIYAGHPYGSPPEGTITTLKAISQDDIRGFFKRYYVGTNAVIAIVGAVDLAGAKQLAEQITGVLPKGSPAPALPEVKPLAKAQREDIAFPSSQSHVRVGQPGMRRGDPDHYALYTGNYILGGSGLVSRLTEEIREKRGLSYSVYSYFSPMDRKGPFMMGLQTRNEQTVEALALLNATLQEFMDKGPSEEELMAARNGIVGGFALRMDSNAKQAELLTMMGYYNLPLDYLDTYIGHIRQVSLKDIRDAFHRHLDPAGKEAG